MKFTLLHPSRGRAEKANATLQNWLSKSSGDYLIQHIISCDIDDPQLDLYDNIFNSKSRSVLIKGPNKNVVQAVNAAASFASGEILIYLSDDFNCPDKWDELIIQKARQIRGQEWMMKVDDCLQKFEVDVVTIPIMSWELYAHLGYFFNPLYHSMHVDQDLYHVCLNNGWLVLTPELKFPHEHYSLGLAPNDDTYKRSDANWPQGEQMFKQRKAENFKL